MTHVRSLTLFLTITTSVCALAQEAGRPDAGPNPPTDAGAPVSPAAQDAGVVPLAAFTDGTFVLADAAATDQATNAAIDVALRSLHPSMRDAFRTQLRATLRFPRRLAISREANRGHVTWDATVLEAGLDGIEVDQRGPEGRSVGVVMRREQAGLSLSQRTAGFVRTDRIGGVEGGVTVIASLRSRLLRRPIEVTASYVSHAP